MNNNNPYGVFGDGGAQGGGWRVSAEASEASHGGGGINPLLFSFAGALLTHLPRRAD
jgi:hypothetical protein